MLITILLEMSFSGQENRQSVAQDRILGYMLTPRITLALCKGCVKGFSLHYA
jgi:hypothetical protein